MGEFYQDNYWRERTQETRPRLWPYVMTGLAMALAVWYWL